MAVENQKFAVDGCPELQWSLIIPILLHTYKAYLPPIETDCSYGIRGRPEMTSSFGGRGGVGQMMTVDDRGGEGGLGY